MNLLELKIKCPACTAEFPLERGTTDKRVFEIAAYAATFGAAWPLVESYLACFRTEKGRGIRPERMAVILGELSAIYKNGKMTFRGNEVVVHQFVLRKVLKDVGARCDTLYPLKDHNYLKKVLESEMNKWHHERTIEEKKRIEHEVHYQGRKKEEPAQPAVQEAVEEVAKSIGQGEHPPAAGAATPFAKGESSRKDTAPPRPATQNEPQKSFTEQCEDLAKRKGINLKAKKDKA